MSTLATTTDRSAVIGVYLERAEAIERMKARAKAPRTVAGYISDWKQLERFGQLVGIGIPPVIDGQVNLGGEPIDPLTIASWIHDSASEGLKPATIARRMASVKHWHRQNRLVSPTDSPDIADLLAGLSRSDESETDQAEPISGPQLVAMLEGIDNDLRGKRDRAILLLGYYSAARRSELCALQVRDITEHDKGMVVRLRKSKTDQTGKGRDIYISYGPRGLCPVRAVRVWLKAASIHDGPIFRGINGEVHDGPMSAQIVNRVVKQGVERIGLDAGKYSAHSLRAGHVSWAVTDEVQAPKVSIRATTGHQSDAMVDHYSRVASADAFEGSSSAYLVRAFGSLIAAK